MQPKQHETAGSGDLFRARLDQIIDISHALVLLAVGIDWTWIHPELAPLYSDKGRPGISDEGVCERWAYDPYFQFFTGQASFQHHFPHERSDLSHWRKRFGGKLDQLLAESLRVVHETGALEPKTWAGSR